MISCPFVIFPKFPFMDSKMSEQHERLEVKGIGVNFPQSKKLKTDRRDYIYADFEQILAVKGTVAKPIGHGIIGCVRLVI